MANMNRYPNKLGIGGWIGKGKWGLERYLYILHRITGIGILFYFSLHIFVTSSRMFGKQVWEQVMGPLQHPIFQLGEYAVFAAFAFHAINGIRLILIEFGFAVGAAEEPIYPYKSSINVQRPLSIVVIVFAVIIAVIGAARYMLHPGG